MSDEIVHHEIVWSDPPESRWGVGYRSVKLEWFFTALRNRPNIWAEWPNGFRPSLSKTERAEGFQMVTRSVNGADGEKVKKTWVVYAHKSS